MASALSQIQELILPNTEDVVALASRASKVQVQLPLVRALRDIVDSGVLATLPAVWQDMEKAGLLADPDGWIVELDGQSLFATVLQMHEAWSKVRELLLGNSLDLAAMAAALMRAQEYRLSHTEEVVALANRATRVQVQLPLVGRLRQIVETSSYIQIESVIDEVDRAGLLTNHEGWIAELEGPRLLASILEMRTSAAEAYQNVQNLLTNCSIDVPAMAAALKRIEELALPHIEEVVNLANRAGRVQSQLPIVRALSGIMETGNLSKAPEVLQLVSSAGLHPESAAWIPELEGQRMITMVLQMQQKAADEASLALAKSKKQLEADAAAVGADAAQKQREGNLSSAKAATSALVSDSVHQKAEHAGVSARQPPHAIKSAASTSAKRMHKKGQKGAGQIHVDDKEKSVASTSVAEEAAKASTVINVAQLVLAAEQLATAGDRLQGVAMGQQLWDISEQVQALADAEPDESSADAAQEVLIELASQVGGLAERIKGVPLAGELVDIADILNSEATGDGECISNFHLSMVAPINASRDELRHTVARLMEEKMELRNALQASLLSALQRADELQSENDGLRRRGMCTADMASLPSEVHVLVEEEARAARAARANLVQEVTRLKTELAAEQVSSRALRAELAAVRALQLKGIKLNGRSRSGSDLSRARSNSGNLAEATGNSAEATATTNSNLEDDTTVRMVCETEEQHPPVVSPTNAVVSALARPSHARGKDRAKRTQPVQRAVTRRTVDFVQRDFSQLSAPEEEVRPPQEEMAEPETESSAISAVSSSDIGANIPGEPSQVDSARPCSAEQPLSNSISFVEKSGDPATEPISNSAQSMPPPFAPHLAPPSQPDCYANGNVLEAASVLPFAPHLVPPAPPEAPVPEGFAASPSGLVNGVPSADAAAVNIASRAEVGFAAGNGFLVV
jgi:hypothetical protein